MSPCNWRRHTLYVPSHHGTPRLDTVLPGNSVLKASVRMGFSAVIWAAERGVMVITHNLSGFSKVLLLQLKKKYVCLVAPYLSGGMWVL